MNFYKHYIGDFQRDTSHLSLTEKGAYLALIHHYYATELPLPKSIDSLCRIAGAVTPAEKRAVKSVTSFFEEMESGLVHPRIEAEIEKAGKVSDKNREIALEREAKRRAQKQAPEHKEIGNENSTNRAQTVQRNVERNEHERSTHQTPDTRHHINPLSESREGEPERVLPPTPADDTTPAPDELTQKIGATCRMLRQECGIQDAAPHHLTRENWAAILGKRSPEEIREFALAKKEANPGKRFGIKYLAPGLLEDPRPLSIGPPGQYPPTGRQARISSYIAQNNALQEIGNGDQLDAINGTARRVDSP